MSFPCVSGHSVVRASVRLASGEDGEDDSLLTTGRGLGGRGRGRGGIGSTGHNHKSHPGRLGGGGRGVRCGGAAY